MPYSLVIFDCDGTLVDSEHLNNLAVLETLNSYGIYDYDMDYALAHFVGLRFSNIVTEVSRQTGYDFPQDAPRVYLEKVRELTPLYLKPVEGAKEVVEKAREESQICVVSNGERNNVISSLIRTDLKQYFPDTHVFSGLMASPKPAPDLFLLAMQTLGAKPEYTLILEDSVVGVRAGIASGAHVWGFCGTHPEPEIHSQILLQTGAHITHNTMTCVAVGLEKKRRK